MVENIDFSAAGPSRVCVELDIEDDMEVEYNETLTVELISSDDITILPSTTVISIVDNDGEYIYIMEYDNNSHCLVTHVISMNYVVTTVSIQIMLLGCMRRCSVINLFVNFRQLNH